MEQHNQFIDKHNIALTYEMNRFIPVNLHAWSRTTQCNYICPCDHASALSISFDNMMHTKQEITPCHTFFTIFSKDMNVGDIATTRTVISSCNHFGESGRLMISCSVFIYSTKNNCLWLSALICVINIRPQFDTTYLWKNMMYRVSISRILSCRNTMTCEVEKKSLSPCCIT